MTAYVDELLVEALIAAPGCPETIVERMLRSSMVSFYQDTKAWRLTTDVSPVIRGRREVELDLPTDTFANSVYWVRLDDRLIPAISPSKVRADMGTPMAYAIDGVSKVLLMDVIPEASYLRNGVVANVSLLPTPSLVDIPDELYAIHKDGILYGAIARLLAMPNVSWGSLNAASTFFSMAEANKFEARRQAAAMQAPITRVVSYGGI